MNIKTLFIAVSLGITLLVVLLVIGFLQNGDYSSAPLTTGTDAVVVDGDIVDDTILSSDLASINIPAGWVRSNVYGAPGMASPDFELRPEEDPQSSECGMAKKGGHIMLSMNQVMPNELYDTSPLSYAKSLLPSETSFDKNFTHELVEINGYPFALISQYYEGCKTGDISVNARINQKHISVHYNYADIDQESAKKFFTEVVNQMKVE